MHAYHDVCDWTDHRTVPTTPTNPHQQTFFFGDDDLESPGGLVAAGGGGGAGGLSVLDAQHWAATAGGGAGGEVDFFAFVLTGGSWPYQNPGGPRVRLPPQLQRCVESFATFYDAKYKRRRLAWLHELGHGEVLFRCPGGAGAGPDGGLELGGSVGGGEGGAMERHYTLGVSTHQMTLLLLFNAREEWTLEALLAELDLDFGELVLCLYPLVKTQVLAVSPAVALASQLTKQHRVAVNLGLSRRASHIAVPRKCDEAELPSSALDSPRSMDPGASWSCLLALVSCVAPWLGPCLLTVRLTPQPPHHTPNPTTTPHHRPHLPGAAERAQVGHRGARGAPDEEGGHHAARPTGGGRAGTHAAHELRPARGVRLRGDSRGHREGLHRAGRGWAQPALPLPGVIGLCVCVCACVHMRVIETERCGRTEGCDDRGERQQ